MLQNILNRRRQKGLVKARTRWSDQASKWEQYDLECGSPEPGSS